MGTRVSELFFLIRIQIKKIFFVVFFFSNGGKGVGYSNSWADMRNNCALFDKGKKFGTMLEKAILSNIRVDAKLKNSIYGGHLEFQYGRQ